jgi:hypothetical protein
VLGQDSFIMVVTLANHELFRQRPLVYKQALSQRQSLLELTTHDDKGAFQVRRRLAIYR